MFEWEFRDPWFLLAALAAPLVYAMLTKRPAASVNYSALTVLDEAPRTLRVRLKNMPAWCYALAALAMAIALAGPRVPDDETRVRREGIAIMMVVDRSGSMQARDLVRDDRSVNRLEVVKSLFARFVLGNRAANSAMTAGPGRPDDVIGVVAFARYADALCPLTLDHGNLINIASDLEIVSQRSEDGTALGEGLAVAVERLRRHPARSKVAVVLTDGVNNAGDITPEQAAELAAAHDIKVYCIGAGTDGTAPVPQIDPFSGRTYLRPMRVEIDEKTLRAIAATTGGKYFRATDAEGLAKVYTEIDRLERTEITEVRYLEYRELYGAFALAALAMIGAGGLMAGSVVRRLP